MIQIELSELKEIHDLLWKVSRGGDIDYAARQKIENLDKRFETLEQAENKADKEFWRAVELIGWESGKNTDYKAAKRLLMTTFNEYQTSALEKRKNVWHSKVYKALDQVVEGYGDDSFGDLCNEIVGRGEKFCKDIIANPTKAQDLKFSESFGYCWPYDSDWSFFDGDGALNWLYKIACKPSYQISEEELNGLSIEDRETVLDIRHKLVWFAMNCESYNVTSQVKEWLEPIYDEAYELFSKKLGHWVIANFLSEIKDKFL